MALVLASWKPPLTLSRAVSDLSLYLRRSTLFMISPNLGGRTKNSYPQWNILSVLVCLEQKSVRRWSGFLPGK